MVKRFHARAAVIAVAVALASTLLTSCDPPPTLAMGVHNDLTYYVDDAVIGATLDAEEAMGSKVARTTLRWNVVNPAQGVFDWSRTDFVVNEAATRGIEVFFVVRDAPQWASGSADPKVVPSGATQFATFVTRYTNFFKAAVKRYGARVKHWEVWSEPNENHFWQPLGLYPKGNMKQWIDLYVQLYKATVAAVKPVNSTVQLATGALTGIGGGCCILGETYLRELIKRKVALTYVAINPHSGFNQAPWDCAQYERSFCGIQRMRDILVAAGKSNVNLWVTEFGWQVGTITRRGTTTGVLRVPGAPEKLALWPASGQVVVGGQTYSYTRIDKTTSYSDIVLSTPMASVPPVGSEVSSPQAEAVQASYVSAAFQMMKGTYVPQQGRPQQNYSYVKMAIYFLSFDKAESNWGMYGLLHSPRPNYDVPGTWVLDPKPASAAFAAEG